MAVCPATTLHGRPCRARVRTGRTFCGHHDPARRRATPRPRATAPIATALDVGALDLEAPAGVGALLAATLRGLARLPFDVRVANAIGQVCAVQRATIEAGNLAARLDALEEAMRERGAL